MRKAILICISGGHAQKLKPVLTAKSTVDMELKEHCTEYFLSAFNPCFNFLKECKKCFVLDFFTLHFLCY